MVLLVLLVVLLVLPVVDVDGLGKADQMLLRIAV